MRQFCIISTVWYTFDYNVQAMAGFISGAGMQAIWVKDKYMVDSVLWHLNNPQSGAESDSSFAIYAIYSKHPFCKDGFLLYPNGTKA